ncbi:MAG: paraquat-inducible protein A [Desulfosarcinaceae bacterium]|nr:paraquat-inducible protein A [Desulfosarcinaceae bacterium]
MSQPVPSRPMASDAHSAAVAPKGLTARNHGLVACPACQYLCRAARLPDHRGAHSDCPRCGARIHTRKPESLARTWALIISAFILYIPANLLPMTYSTKLGLTQVDTIMSGVIYFILTGAPHLALIIFVASICVPLIKLVLLTYLLLSIHRQSHWRPRERTRFYRIVEVIGRWSMVDIFAVTIVAALVKAGALASVEIGSGAFFFGAVVILTMLAAMTFDPRLIWDAMENPHEHR